MKRFFQFIGHLTTTIIKEPYTSLIKNKSLIHIVYWGAETVIPLSIFTLLIGFGTALTINTMLSRLNMQQQAMILAQNILIEDILPFIISFVLASKAALMLIDKEHPILSDDAMNSIMKTWITPLITGNLINALILYIYTSTLLIFSIFITFDYILSINISEYLLRLNDNLNLKSLSLSLCKTLLMTIITGIIAGFYYYSIAKKFLSLRKAVVKILSRELFWLMFFSGIIKTITSL